MAEGLAEVHRRGLIHRDMKPKNILLDEDLPQGVSADWVEEQIDMGALRFKVTDFGLVMDVASREGRRGGFAGTRMFASPEQIRQDHVDFRSDIYSMGLTLWFLVCGRGPLTGPTRESMSEEQATGMHVSPNEYDSWLPDELSPGFRTMLSKMVRKNPAERFQSARDVAAEAQVLLSVLAGGAPEGNGAGPALAPQMAGNALQKQMLEHWGKEPDENLIAEPVGAGTRPLGEGNARLYTAKWVPTGEPIKLTVWHATGALDDAAEREFGDYLCGLGGTANLPDAPLEIIPFNAVLRTAEEWWVAELQIEGEPLDAFLSYLDRR